VLILLLMIYFTLYALVCSVTVKGKPTLSIYVFFYIEFQCIGLIFKIKTILEFEPQLFLISIAK
jgi:hypothetical protein